jgi:hypothetical protein
VDDHHPEDGKCASEVEAKDPLGRREGRGRDLLPGNVSQGVLHQVEPAALPRHAGEAGLSRLGEPRVRVARDQLHAVPNRREGKLRSKKTRLLRRPSRPSIDKLGGRPTHE